MRKTLAMVAMMCLCTSTAMADFTSDSSNPFITITDNAYNGTLGSMVSDSISVTGHTGGNLVSLITVDITLSHTWTGDLVIALGTPNGQILGLVSRPGFDEVGDGTGCCGNNGDWFSGASASFFDGGANSGESLFNVSGGETFFAAPEATVAFLGSEPDFAALNGQLANGSWTLYVGDAAGGDVGVFESWTINITSIPAPGALALLGMAGLVSRRRRRS